MRRFFAATCDEERAIAIGYASHLLADVVAHNHFVPEHETRLVNVPHATHALCEWAMDTYVRQAVLANPDELLDAERTALMTVVARHLRCSESLVQTAILALARGTQILHASRVPRLCRAILRSLDYHAAPRFEAYMRETVAQLAQIADALAGFAPEADPEPAHVIAPRTPFSSTRLAQPRSLS